MTPQSQNSASTALLVMYIAGFGLMLLFAGILNQIGASGVVATTLALAFLVGTYVFSAFFAGTMRLSDFGNAQRSADPLHNGMGIAAGGFSGFFTLSLAGLFFDLGIRGIIWSGGLITGIALMTVLFSASYARTRSVTIPEFLMGADSGNSFFRGFLILIVVFCSLAIATAQFQFLAIIGQRFLGINAGTVILSTLVATLLCTLAGGLQSTNLARTLSYILIASGILIPLIWISLIVSGIPLPQLGYGLAAIGQSVEIHSELVEIGQENASSLKTVLDTDYSLNSFELLSGFACIAAGFAAMPHLLQHFAAVRTGYQARRSGAWAVLFLLLLLTAIPAIAAFMRFEIYQILIGAEIEGFASGSNWLFQLSGVSNSKFILVCGEYVGSYAELLSACGTGHIISLSDIVIDPTFIPLALPALSQLPDILTTIAVLGVLAALWSTIDGTILCAALTLSHDGYLRLMRPKSPLGVRLFVTRLLLAVIACLATFLALNSPVHPLTLVTFSVAFCAATLFPILVARNWWPNVAQDNLFAGTLTGAIVTSVLFYISLVEQNLSSFIIPLSGERLDLLDAGFLGMISTFAIIGISNLLNNLRKPKEEPEDV